MLEHTKTWDFTSAQGCKDIKPAWTMASNLPKLAAWTHRHRRLLWSATAERSSQRHIQPSGERSSLPPQPPRRISAPTHNHRPTITNLRFVEKESRMAMGIKPWLTQQSEPMASPDAFNAFNTIAKRIKYWHWLPEFLVTRVQYLARLGR